MKVAYIFKIVLKYQKGRWVKIRIKGDDSLGDLDKIIRESFNYDLSDHLSMFFVGRAWNSKDFGQIEPGGHGLGAKPRIKQLGLVEGSKMEHVYDFGADIQHIVILETMEESDRHDKTPCVIQRSRTRVKYCTPCGEMGKKVKAEWRCMECSENAGKVLYLCDDCCERDHEDHLVEEIFG